MIEEADLAMCLTDYLTKYLCINIFNQILKVLSNAKDK